MSFFKKKGEVVDITRLQKQGVMDKPVSQQISRVRFKGEYVDFTDAGLSHGSGDSSKVSSDTSSVLAIPAVSDATMVPSSPTSASFAPGALGFLDGLAGANTHSKSTASVTPSSADSVSALCEDSQTIPNKFLPPLIAPSSDDSVVSVDASQSAGSSVVSSDKGLQHVMVKVEDLEFKIDRLVDRLVALEDSLIKLSK